MNRKLCLILALILLISTLTSCSFCFSGKNKEENNSTENITEETTAEETTAEAETLPVAGKEDKEIVFSSSKAKNIGSFESAKYGKLIVYLQEGYFLIFNDFEKHLFTVFAENISVSETDAGTVIGADMNFDGVTDFGVRYYKDELNSYYYCFLWDNNEKNFTYFHPLTGLANPVFEEDDETVREVKRITYSKYTEKVYAVNKDSIKLLMTNENTEEATTNEQLGGESVPTKVDIMENGNSALLTLYTRKNSEEKWQCYIEDESIISLSSDNRDALLRTHEFLLTSVSEGATTVIFRYISAEDEEITEEININAYVSADMTVKIIVP